MTVSTALQEVQISIGDTSLAGDLSLPERALGIILFAHGSGSGRWSPRNIQVAEELNREGLGTLLVDLLTPDEDDADQVTGRLRFNIPFLADRLLVAHDWIRRHGSTRLLPLGYFGASTGAGAALVAASRRPDDVRAVVSRGGRPDLAEDALERVAAPTLFIVGAADPEVLELNKRAAARMGQTQSAIEIVAGATHLFEEPGALDRVASLAGKWFRVHLPDRTR